MQHRRRLGFAGLSLAVLATFNVVATPVSAAFGDTLSSFDAEATAGVPGCGVGTGIAFDGDSLYLSCWGSPTLYKVDPATQASEGSITVAVGDVGAMAYDGGRDRLWICNSGSTVHLVNPQTGAADPSVTPFPVAGCIDGLAYDGEDDTLWTSPDANGTTSHYAIDGTLLSSNANGMCNSGIAVGGDRLYLADNCSNKLWQVDKDFGSQTLLSSFSRRMEDLECDELTFAPKSAIWAQDAYDRILTAYEIPAGSCDHGGSAASCALISVAITRPALGRTYENDIDVGAAAGTDPIVAGSPLTVAASTTGPVGSVSFYLDGTFVAADNTAPFEVTLAGPFAQGTHKLSARATHATDRACRSRHSLSFAAECALIGLAIDRPQPARLYLGDADIGGTTGPATVIAGDLTAAASVTKPNLVADVTFEIPGVVAPVTVSTPPFSPVLDLSAATPGTTGVLEVTANFHEAGCFSTVSLPIRFADPTSVGIAQAVSVTQNVPVEPVVTAGGAQAIDGTSDDVFLDLGPTGPLDRAIVIHDTASSSLIPSEAEATSLIEHVSLFGGDLVIESLHARARVERTSGLSTQATFAGSYVARVTVQGTPIVIDQPNTTIAVPGVGRVTFLETDERTSVARHELTVMAVHAFVDTPVKHEIVLGMAHAAINLIEPQFEGPADDLIHQHDDAGTDLDAPDTVGAGTPIVPGGYTGMLRDGGDADVFTFEAGQGDRIIATARASERISYRLGGTAGLLPNDVTLELFDPTGVKREFSNTPAHVPDRVELNADRPYSPEGTKGTWSLRVSGTAGVFYTLTLSLPPNPLLDQQDAMLPGDAGDTCATARALPAALQPNELDQQVVPGVIRDVDQADHFSFDATLGQLVTVVLKPDTLADGADFDLTIWGPDTPGGTTDCSTPVGTSTLGKKPVPKAAPDAVTRIPVTRTGRHTIGVTRVNAVANYVVEISVTNPNPTQPANDARTGADAANTCSGAMPVTTGTYQGRILDHPSDHEDWYRFDVPAGGDVTVSVVPSPGSAMVAVVRSACTGNPLASTAPRLVSQQPWEFSGRDIAAGTYQLGVRLDAPGGGNYQFTITVTP